MNYKEKKSRVKKEKRRSYKEKYSKKEIIEVFDRKKNKNDEELFCLKFKGEKRKKWLRIDNFDINKRKLIVDLYSTNPNEKKEYIKKNKKSKTKSKKRRLKNNAQTIDLSRLEINLSEIMPIKTKLNISDKEDFEYVKNCLDDCFFVKEEKIRDKEKDSINKIYERDILKAIKIKNHIVINKIILFSLIWENKSTNEFYSNHFFNMEQLEKKIPGLLLKYFKKNLIYNK